MKVMTAREAKNRFGEFLDSARREPVVVTKNNRPVGIMISVENAADTLWSDFFIDPRYGEWLFGKVAKTLEPVDAAETRLHGHEEAMALLDDRLAARLCKTLSRG